MNEKMQDMGALTSLDLSNNYIGDLVYSSGGKGNGKGNRKGNMKGKGKGKGGKGFRKGKGKGKGGTDKGGLVFRGGLAFNKGKPEGTIALASAIKGMKTLTMLNLANNNLGELVLPEGWTEGIGPKGGPKGYAHTDGRMRKESPGKPKGLTALASAISGMGALTILDISKNRIGERWSGRGGSLHDSSWETDVTGTAP
jgi:Leucine-rich repeat (LRR) protein